MAVCVKEESDVGGKKFDKGEIKVGGMRKKYQNEQYIPQIIYNITKHYNMIL